MQVGMKPRFHVCPTLVIVERIGAAKKYPRKMLGRADGFPVGLHRALPQGHAHTPDSQLLLAIAVRKVDALPEIEVVGVDQAAQAVMTKAAPESGGQVVRSRVLPDTAWRAISPHYPCVLNGILEPIRHPSRCSASHLLTRRRPGRRGPHE